MADLIQSASITTDAVVFTVSEHSLSVLLVERAYPPFQGCHALPGGFVEADETLEQCVRRELEEETGVSAGFLEQLYTFGDPGRDPRGRTISTAFLALLPGRPEPAAGTDARAAAWHDVDSLPALAFDHAEIVAMALDRLRAKLHYSDIALRLLPETFTLGELQRVCEVVLGESLDKRNFRKRVVALGMVEETGGKQRNGNHRPARLYRPSHAGPELRVFT